LFYIIFIKIIIFDELITEGLSTKSISLSKCPDISKVYLESPLCTSKYIKISIETSITSVGDLLTPPNILIGKRGEREMTWRTYITYTCTSNWKSQHWKIYGAKPERDQKADMTREPI